MNEFGKRLDYYTNKLIEVGYWSQGKLNSYGIRYAYSNGLDEPPTDVEFGSFISDEY